MKEYTYQLDLYGLYDRAFEDCIANVTLNVPDTFEHHAPKLEEISVKEITIERDTESYLATFSTDIPAFIERIKRDMSLDRHYDEFIEQYGDTLEDNVCDEWVETATIPDWEETGKPIEMSTLSDDLPTADEMAAKHGVF